MKLIKLLASATIVMCTILASGAAMAQSKKIKIATEGAYAPWNFMEAGKLAGYEIDLAAELCKRAKLDCEVIAQDWDGIIPGLNAGKFDAIMAGMTNTEKRREVIAFSESYGATPNGFLTTKASPLAKLPGLGNSFSLAKQEADANKVIEEMKALLKGKVIGVQVSTTNAGFVEKYFKGVAEIRDYKTTEQHDLDLKAGRIDATFAAMSYQNDVVAKPDNAEMALAGATFTGGVLGSGVGVGLRKADTELKASFDAAIKSAILNHLMVPSRR